MLLKKQTVWLLTMLSLVFVLSAYYFIGDQKANDQMATNPADNEAVENQDGGDGEDAQAGAVGEEGEEGAEGTDGDDSAVVKYISTDETFAEMRYELENLRSEHRQNLKDIMASTDLPAEEISKAADQYNELAQIQEKELILESTIRTREDVEDALVRVTDGKIRVTVKPKGEHTVQMANEIHHLIRKEFSNVRNENIAFEFSNPADTGE
ncbi:Stage III sporulation protein AH [Bacillus sp. THAF10]|uniref:SpoIIIAH-like family protein n=1 Tax=Bacillus sp. THAF10 TaxID=2587848 RepID=UPI001268D773|nr:SpoIIIAH-like family protein [Bacillus sp. THAF10]QFT89744.1 Stage III sporulation protein AH [Bacillus sp. THAF10]